MGAQDKPSERTTREKRAASASLPLPKDARTVQRIFDSLHRFCEWFGDEADKALRQARIRHLGSARYVHQCCRFIRSRYVVTAKRRSKVARPGGLSVPPNLAIGLKYLDEASLATTIDKLDGAITRLTAYEGKRFGRALVLIGTPAERAKARKRLREEAAAAPEAVAEAAALDDLDHALRNVVDLFSRTAEQFASRLVTGTVKHVSRKHEKASTLTPPEVAKRLGVSKNKIYAWIKSGELPAVNVTARPGSRPRYLITESDLTVFQEKRRTAKPSPVTRTRRRKDPNVIEYF
jgi:excisionase family DNA binding protein